MNYKDITWVVQSGAIARSDFDALVRSVEQVGCRLETLQLVPFSHEVVGELPEVTGPCLTYGSSGLLSVGRQAGWRPAGWDGNRFSMSATIDALSERTVNRKAKFCRLADAAETVRKAGWAQAFLRPDSETKTLQGRTYKLEDLSNWLDQLHAAGDLSIADEWMVVAPALALGREWRGFVVDGQVVSVCQYADQGELVTSVGAPDEVADFMAECLEIYRPAPCCVIDVGESLDHGRSELAVIEFNSINSAGFYACNIDAIARALSTFVLGEEPGKGEG